MTPKPTVLAPPPPHLSPAAKREWARMVKAMPARMLRGIDRAALAFYCQDYGRWEHAEKELAKTNVLVKTKTGRVIQNPWLSVANRAMGQMKDFLAEFGLCPVARIKKT